jgi:hypothetical protein
MDWEGYSTLTFVIENPGEPFIVHFRIDDASSCIDYQCRYNHVVELVTGENTVHIPLDEIRSETRSLDLSSIVRVILFTDDVPVDTFFRLHRVELTHQ